MEVFNDLLMHSGLFFDPADAKRSPYALGDTHCVNHHDWPRHSLPEGKATPCQPYSPLANQLMPNQAMVVVNERPTVSYSYIHGLEHEELEYYTSPALASDSLSNKSYSHTSNTETMRSSFSAHAQRLSEGGSPHFYKTSPLNSASSSLESSGISKYQEVAGSSDGFLDHMMDFMLDESYLMEPVTGWLSGAASEPMSNIADGPLVGEICSWREGELIVNSGLTNYSESMVSKTGMTFPSFSSPQGQHDKAPDALLEINSLAPSGTLDGATGNFVWRQDTEFQAESAREMKAAATPCVDEQDVSDDMLRPLSKEEPESPSLRSNKRKLSDSGCREPEARKLTKYDITACQNEGSKSETSDGKFCLVHLLVAATEAVAARNMDLASVILARLKESISYSGSVMQRVAAYFSDGLQCHINGGLLDVAWNNVCLNDMLLAFQILHEISPYIKFGHFTANQAILEAIEGQNQVHILDYEIMEGMQWAPLMQALLLRTGGPPRLHITALCRPNDTAYGWASTQATGKRLSEFAASVNLPFDFSIVKVGEDDKFNISALKVIKGEAFVVNCMLHLPHMPYRRVASVATFLRSVKKMSPMVLTLVEEELGSSTSSSSAAHYLFLALHHYSAMFDSLNACLPGEPVVRTLVERVFLWPRIKTAAACLNGGLPSSSSSSSSLSSSSSSSSSPSYHCAAGGERAPAYNWCSLVQSLGFKSLPLSFHSTSQARLLLGLYRDGFRVEKQSNRLLLGWCSRNLFAASAWS